MPHPYWPLFGLVLRTPRLTLRYPDDQCVTALAALAARGIHEPDQMPFKMPWTRQPPGVLEREALRFHWSARAATSPESWQLPFAVYDGDTLVGLQEVQGKNFAVARSVSTGSWLGREYQGRGIGKIMRAAVLSFAFDRLGADFAHTSCWVDNAASAGVTRSLGYEPNGWSVLAREGHPVRHLQFVLTRERWSEQGAEAVAVSGFEACRSMLGLEPVTA